MTKVRPKATRKASRRRLAMAVVFLVLLSSYVGLSYQTILSAARDDSVVRSAASAYQPLIFQINFSIVRELVNTSGAAISRSAGTVPYFVVTSTQNRSNVLGLVYLSTDISPSSTYGYNSMLNSLAYVTTNGTILGVRILNNSESYGYYVTDDWLLSFVNRSVFEPLVVSQDFDGISRATMTSVAIVAGIRDAGRVVLRDYASLPPSPPTIQYLFVNSGLGITDPPTGIYEFSEEVPFDVTAKSNESVRLDHWEVDGQPDGNYSTVTVLMNTTHTVVAVFSTSEPTPPPPLTRVLVIQTSSAQTSPVPGVNQYLDGENVTVTAVAKAGFRFDHWELDGNTLTTNSSVTFPMDRDHVLRAVFTAIPLPPAPVSPFSKIQTKDLLSGGAYGAFFLVAIFAFRRDSDRFTNLLLAASVLFIGFFEGRMVTIVDSILLVPAALPPALTHILWYTLYAGVLVTSLTLGRLYCGYLCPFGALTALLNKAFPFKRRLPSGIHNRLVYLKYVVLAFVFVEVISGAFWAAGLEPFTPVFLFKGDWWMVFLAVAFVAVSAVFERFYCKYLCPAGAAMALVSQIRVFEIRRWDECRRCRICDRSCPEGAIVNGRISPRECLNCRVCEVNYLDEDICPHYAIERAQRRVATA